MYKQLLVVLVAGLFVVVGLVTVANNSVGS